MGNLKEIKIIDGVTTGMSFAKDINDNFNILSGATTATTTQVQSDWNATTGVASILNKPTIPAAQVQSDWNATTGVASILNKPTIPAAQVQSDWNATSGVTAILNKPTIPAAQIQSDWTATTGLGVILNKPTIPAAQVQSNWNATSGVTAILNKPTIPAAQVQSDWNATTGLGVILNKPTIPTGGTGSMTGDEIVTLLETETIRSTRVLLNQTNLTTAWNAGQGSLYKLVLSGDTTLNNPTNIVVGALYQIEIHQNNVGGWILSWGSQYKFPNGDEPIITLDVGAVDIITIYVMSSTELLVTYVQNFI